MTLMKKINFHESMWPDRISNLVPLTPQRDTKRQSLNGIANTCIASIGIDRSESIVQFRIGLLLFRVYCYPFHLHLDTVNCCISRELW